MKKQALGCCILAATTMFFGAVVAEADKNDFVSVQGDGLTGNGDGFVAVDPNKPLHYDLTVRDGWSFDDGSTHKEGDIEPGDSVTFTVVSELGEESETFTIDNPWKHVHDQETRDSEHKESPSLEIDPGPLHVLMAFAAEDQGVVVKSGFEVRASEYMHLETVTPIPCPVPGCTVGHGEPVTSEVRGKPSVTVKTNDPTPTKGTKTQPVKTDDGFLLGAGTFGASCEAEGTGLCDECNCSAKSEVDYIVISGEVKCPPYIGLDMTDEGKKTTPGIKADLICGPDNGDVVFERVMWSADPASEVDQFSVVWDVVSLSSSCICRPKSNTKASARYTNEVVQAVSTMHDDDFCFATLSCSNRFTIVKVDVTINDVEEEDEETEGAYALYCKDKDADIWSARGTNSLLKVTFDIEPYDLPTNDMVELTFPEKFLYTKETTHEGDIYEPAKTKYTIGELRKTRFVLHGHEEGLDQQIKIEHKLSKAIDVAKFHVLDLNLVPDFDRNHAIDDKDLTKNADDKMFYWWLNDDADEGDSANCSSDTGSDIPGSGPIRSKNNDDTKVNGRRDLLDFFPLGLYIGESAGMVLDDTSPYYLRLDPTGMGYAWTELEADKAGTFLYTKQEQPKSVSWLGGDLCESKVVIKKEALEKKKLNGCKKENWCVLMCEARDESSSIKLEFCKKAEKGGEDEVLLTVPFKCTFKNVLDLINQVYIDEKGPGAIEKMKVDEKEFATDDVDILSLHGYKVSREFAKGWHSEFFKRIYQSGMNPRFTGVTWPGYVEAESDILKWKFDSSGLYYHACVYSAFRSAPALARFFKEMPDRRSKTVVMAHSLGNMVVSSAINDHGMRPDMYLLLNAAVASEAYNEEEYNPAGGDSHNLVLKNWCKKNEEYPEESYASYWHNFFKNDDSAIGKSYRRLTWKSRFKNVTSACKAINLMSAGDEVFELSANDNFNMSKGAKLILSASNGQWDGLKDLLIFDLDLSRHSWQKQEVGKGVLSALNKQHDSDMAGWGFAANHPEDVSAALTKEDKRRWPYKRIESIGFDKPWLFKDDPVFHTNPVSVFEKQTKVLDDDGINRMLACAIPAISTAMGTTKVNGMTNYDMTGSASQSFKDRGGDYGKRWLHCDIKDRSYFDTYKLWDNRIKNLIGLGKK